MTDVECTEEGLLSDVVNISAFGDQWTNSVVIMNLSELTKMSIDT